MERSRLFVAGLPEQLEGPDCPDPAHARTNNTRTVSLWCLVAAPLIFSGDITRLDDFTLGLLTNDEVIDVDQDPLGKPGRRMALDGDREVWARDLENGTKAVGLFNRGETPATMTAQWTDLGLGGTQIVRDLWRQKDLGRYRDEFKSSVLRHGVVLIRIAKP